MSKPCLIKHLSRFTARLGATTALAAAVLLPAGGVSAMETAVSPVADVAEIAADTPFIPSEYGEVIFQKDGGSLRQIFIIGQSHRSGATGRNGSDTVQVQTEIYRIGEHLIRENEIELLLPEGFFQRSAEGFAPIDPNRSSPGLDSETLSTMLSAEDRFVNADMLLRDSFDIRLAQVEDEELYRDVLGLLQQSSQENRFSLFTRLGRVQKKRSAVMLQNIADVVEQTYRDGAINSRRAIFTIGLAHVDEIIGFLKKGEIPLDEDLREQLKLLERGYGVTVIIPRTLADSEEALRMARLNLD